MYAFHYRCGERIALSNDNCTATRNDSEFDHGLVISAEPLINDVLFEVNIDRKVSSWSGTLEIGVVDVDPLYFEFPPCASKIQTGSWILSGTSIFRNGNCLLEGYGIDLEKLNQDDKVGILKTSEGDLIFYVNGDPQGVAAEGLPTTVYAVVDLYGKCVQVTLSRNISREHNNDDCLSGSSVLAIDNDILNVTLGADLSELSLSSSNSLDIRMDMNASLNLPEETRVDRIRFHDRCGSLVKLSNGSRTAERRRPLDEFNNGVVMTHRPMQDSELFEIRIDRLVDKWSGSIEMGITTHNPNSLVFPATMTNMRSGTIMMSGCGILTNGKGTRREYGDFNLDELSEGDRVGMMRKPNGDLHYFINGLDQGVAAQRVPVTVWGVIDLYGMTIKVSIVERDEREEQNLITRKNTCCDQMMVSDLQPMPDYYDRLTFHNNCGTHAQVINNGRTAHRPNASDDFNNGVVLTARPLKTGEFFEVRLDRVVTKWAGSIEIGVTTHSPMDLEFPFTMTNVRSGTWMMTGSGIMNNGSIIQEQYGVNLDRLQVGDRVGVVRKDNGQLHFFVNGVDQGSAANNVPEKVYGVVDLYGQAVGVTIMDMYNYASPDTLNSSMSNTTLYSDLRFHHVHGKNARIVNNGLTALRPRPFAEFNDAIVFSSRPLKDGELFEIVLDCVVDRWSGSIELGVTAVRPDDIELPSTATDLCKDTWMLSGSSIMVSGKTMRTNYSCDLDTLTTGVRLGVMRTSDKSLEFFKDGVSQGIACLVPHPNIYAVVDLYGQCAQVSIPCFTPVVPLVPVGLDTIHRSDTSISVQATSVLHQNADIDLHQFSEFHSRGVYLSDNGRTAARSKEFTNAVIFSSAPLLIDELFEISIISLSKHIAGSLSIGFTDISPCDTSNKFPKDCFYITGNQVRHQNKIIQLFTPSLDWLSYGDRIGILQTQNHSIKIFINGEELAVTFPVNPQTVYALFDLRGNCSEVSITSHKVSLSPLNSIRLHDSLELVVDQEQQLVESEGHKDIEPCSSGDNYSFSWSFLANHGRNIELSEDYSVARRITSYNHGIVLIKQPIQLNKIVQVQILNTDSEWSSSIIVGLISGLVDNIGLPSNALSMKGSCCIVSNDWISINGVKTTSNFGEMLNKLSVGSTVGIILTENACLKLVINNVESDPLHWPHSTNQPVYGLFDLYGQCQEVKIMNLPLKIEKQSPKMDCEKADLESYEKESTNSNLTLELPSNNSTSAPNNYLRNSTILSPTKSCKYKEECQKVKTKLLLPDLYFDGDNGICYCNDCLKNSKSENSEKESVLAGWVKFPLKNITNVTPEKWHTAFYATKLGAVRYILDHGQLLTKGQLQQCNFTSKQHDDVQVVFYPNLKNCKSFGYKMNDNEKVFTTFQICVKPGAYSISRDLDVIEWNTKEAGAITLNALLIQIVLN